MELLDMGQRGYQSGFGAVGIVVVLAVVAVVAVGGFVVYHHNKSNTGKSNAATNSAQTTTQQKSTTTTQTQQTATQYLDIKEWGVKLPLSSSISDAYYVPSVGSSKGADGQPNTLLLGLKSLDSSGCAAANSTAIGMIFRALPSETDSATGKLLTQEYPNGITIGGYFYAYQKLNSDSCKAPDSTLQSVDTGLSTAAKHAVPESAN